MEESSAVQVASLGVVVFVRFRMFFLLAVCSVMSVMRKSEMRVKVRSLEEFALEVT